MAKYLTAKQLGIEPWERKGLIAFVKAAPGLKHNPEPRRDYERYSSDLKGLSDFIFNMAYGVIPGKCGTVACVGGFVALRSGLSGLEADRYVMLRQHSPALTNLYFPPGSDYSKITTAEAAKATEHFLLTSQIKWEKVYD